MDVIRAAELFECAVDAGNLSAMCNLGHMLKHGGEGIEKDGARACELCERAANGGDYLGMRWLVWLLAHGWEGVPKDVTRAVDLYRKVIDEIAREGSMVRLAMILQEGDEEVERDAAETVRLYRRAIDLGFEYALLRLEDYLEFGGHDVAENITRVTPMCPVSRIDGRA